MRMQREAEVTGLTEPAIFRETARLNGVPIGEHVGDSPSDVETGRQAGAHVVAVATGKAGEAELAADVVLADLCDTAAVVGAVLGWGEGGG